MPLRVDEVGGRVVDGRGGECGAGGRLGCEDGDSTAVSRSWSRSSVAISRKSGAESS